MSQNGTTPAIDIAAPRNRDLLAEIGEIDTGLLEVRPVVAGLRKALAEAERAQDELERRRANLRVALVALNGLGDVNGYGDFRVLHQDEYAVGQAIARFRGEEPAPVVADEYDKVPF